MPSPGHAPASLPACTHHCGSNLTFMYGTRDAPLYSDIELFLQTGVYGDWALVTVVFWILSPSFNTKTFREIKGLLWVNQSLVCLLGLFSILAIHFHMLDTREEDTAGIRLWGSCVLALQRSAMVEVLGAVFGQFPGTDLRVSIMFWLGLAVYGGLNLTYVVLDFLIAGQAMDYFEEVGVWLLGDRDFGLTLHQGMVERFKMGAARANQTLEFVEWRLRLPGSLYKRETYLGRRNLQVQIGVSADVLAFALTVMLGILVLHLWFTQRGTAMRRRIVRLLVAITGLALATTFQLVVAVHYILWNWAVITAPSQWEDVSSGDPTAFPSAYRIVSTGFPILSAILQGLGLVAAAAVAVLLARAQQRERREALFNALYSIITGDEEVMEEEEEFGEGRPNSGELTPEEVPWSWRD